MGNFAYIGFALTLSQFEGYVKTYDFGKVLPDFIVLHHTANPDASWAPLSSDPRTKWDRDEAGLTPIQVRSKRLRQLEGVMRYYRDTLGWNAGPHLFCDNLYIYLFTPMNQVGIHAKWGNGFRQGGKLHYSIGIEVVGCFDKVAWNSAISALVGGAVRALQARLGTFALSYLYPTPESKPGMAIVNGEQVCAHPDQLRFGGISSHRDYNKPSCPGSAITEDFYMSVINPATFPTLYTTVRATTIYQDSAATMPIGNVVKGTLLMIDGARYPQPTGHISKTSPTFADLGFVMLADLDVVK